MGSIGTTGMVAGAAVAAFTTGRIARVQDTMDDSAQIATLGTAGLGATLLTSGLIMGPLGSVMFGKTAPRAGAIGTVSAVVAAAGGGMLGKHVDF